MTDYEEYQEEYGEDNDYYDEPQGRRPWFIVVAVAVVVLLCCCCLALVAGIIIFKGDIVDALEGIAGALPTLMGVTALA